MEKREKIVSFLFGLSIILIIATFALTIYEKKNSCFMLCNDSPPDKVYEDIIICIKNKQENCIRDMCYFYCANKGAYDE